MQDLPEECTSSDAISLPVDLSLRAVSTAEALAPVCLQGAVSRAVHTQVCAGAVADFVVAAKRSSERHTESQSTTLSSIPDQTTSGLSPCSTREAALRNGSCDGKCIPVATATATVTLTVPKHQQVSMTEVIT